MFLTTALRQQARYSRRLYVGNLSWMTSEQQLRDYFWKFGTVNSVRLFFNKETGLSRQFAFVDFKNPDGANAALAKLSHCLDGKDITLNLALRTIDSRFKNDPANNEAENVTPGVEDDVVPPALEPEFDAVIDASKAATSPSA